jgi:hypothetical protein
MKKRIPNLALSAFLFLIFSKLCWAGVIYHNFEPEYGTAVNVGSVGTSVVSVVDRHEAVHLGRYAIKSNSPFYWTGVNVAPQNGAASLDLKQSNNDRLTFWTYALPQRNCYIYGCDAGTDNTVGLVFYDNNLYQSNGFEVWTTQTARYGQWSKMKILFSQLPPDFDLTHVTKIDFKNYWPGDYYFDDIHAVREDRLYQTFEKEERSGSMDNEYGWKWMEEDLAALSASGEPVFEGSHSWKLVSTAKWGGTGIQSNEKKYFNNNGTIEQTFWHVDLCPENNDRLTFWVYGLPENGMDNNLAVQFYDNGNHFTDDTKVVVWSKKAATYGRWTKMSVLFSDVKKNAPDFDLANINKLQFQHYWPGTYYIDNIRATGPEPVIQEAGLREGLIQWQAISGAVNYRLQESVEGPNGPWQTVYSGPNGSYQTSRISKSWWRVRWEESFVDKNTLPYASGWSNIATYLPASIVFKFSALQNGYLEWSAVPQTSLYEIQSGSSKYGPWISFYRGPKPASNFNANAGTWYRIRGIREEEGKVIDLSPWSRPQTYNPGKGFVRASGTVLKDADGAGDELVLSGVNFGGGFVIEPWMTALGLSDSPALEDDWSIREQLIQRFGGLQAENLLRIYQEAYFNSFDFDFLLDSGITLVRLPFYYRNFQDDDGNWILNDAGQIDFSWLDRVVNALADRGIYVLLDMHGAPGAQNSEATTGRKNFNKLFASDGEIYRIRTEAMWVEVAKHYKDNPWVLGYDLLNEPFGAAPDNEVLANMYDRLYKAIRAIDSSHLIVMEGIWYQDPNDPEPDPAKKRYIVDWETLPDPAAKGWSNVLYEFHFYLWNNDDDVLAHKAYVDQKIAEAGVKQSLYNVPVLIGEFYGFNSRPIWEYYLESFSAQKWSWITWSYKHYYNTTPWGLLTQGNYDEEWPKFTSDSYEDLSRKLSKYRTEDYHVLTVSLRDLVTSNSLLLRNYPDAQPTIISVSKFFVVPGHDFIVTGKNFGATQDLGIVSYAGVPLPVVSWSDASIHVYLRSGEPQGSGAITVTTSQGTSNGVDIISRGSGGSGGGFSGTSGGEFVLLGGGFGDIPGRFQFYPAPCESLPPDFKPCNNGDAAISYWSSTKIKGYVPPDAALVGERYNFFTNEAGDLYPTMIRENSAPVLDSIGAQAVNEGETLSFNLNATDADQDALIYSAVNLPLGATFLGQTFSWTPGYNQSGNYSLTFRVSDGTSSDEETVVIAVQNVSLPDLVLTALSTTATVVTPGMTVPILVTIKNQGISPAGTSVISYHLSRDAVYGGGDDIALSAVTSVNSLKASLSKTFTPALRIPAETPVGSYYLCAEVDSAKTILEEDETNNDRSTQVTFALALPDLVIRAFSGPASAGTGSSINVLDSVENQGASKAGAFYVGYYLSSDSVVSIADTRIGRRYVSSLAAQAVNSTTTSVSIPRTLVPGTYYLGAVADYVERSPEQDETNNTSPVVALAVIAGPDLVVSSVSGPASAAKGSIQPFHNAVTNQGIGDAAVSYAGIYLSPDSNITSADRRIGQRYVGSLVVGNTSVSDTMIQIPRNLPSGIYYVGAIADCRERIAEQDETNNALVGNALTIE